MDWKDRIAELRAEWTGRKVIYQGEQHTVVDVDYNGALLIDRETMYNKTRAGNGLGRGLFADRAGTAAGGIGHAKYVVVPITWHSHNGRYIAATHPGGSGKRFLREGGITCTKAQ